MGLLKERGVAVQSRLKITSQASPNLGNISYLCPTSIEMII